MHLAVLACACLASASAFVPDSAPLLGWKSRGRLTSVTLCGGKNFAGYNMVEKYGNTHVQIITDIDDTVKSSGGVRLLGKIGPALGGIDTQYKRGDFYPGVFQFAVEVANYGNPPNMQAAPVAVLTARARELKLFLALKPSTKLCVEYVEAAKRLFDDYGIGNPKWGIDCENTVLYGSVIEWILQYRKGWRKFDNFKKLREQKDGRRKYVLVGDTGEYDPECGENMAKEFPDEVRGLFFHHVSEYEWMTNPVLLPADKKINNVPVYYFRTYVGAARKAMRIGLIGPDELIRIAKEAQMALKDVPREDEKWQDLYRDLELAIIELGMSIKPQQASKSAGLPSIIPPLVAVKDQDGAKQDSPWFRNLKLPW